MWGVCVCILLAPLYLACVFPYTGLARTIHVYICTVFIRYFWQGNLHKYGHIRYVHMVLANTAWHACLLTQALRKQLLLSGDVPTLVSATASDIAALEPKEFWALYKASR